MKFFKLIFLLSALLNSIGAFMFLYLGDTQMGSKKADMTLILIGIYAILDRLEKLENK